MTPVTLWRGSWFWALWPTTFPFAAETLDGQSTQSTRRSRLCVLQAKQTRWFCSCSMLKVGMRQRPSATSDTQSNKPLYRETNRCRETCSNLQLVGLAFSCFRSRQQSPSHPRPRKERLVCRINDTVTKLHSCVSIPNTTNIPFDIYKRSIHVSALTIAVVSVLPERAKRSCASWLSHHLFSCQLCENRSPPDL